MVPFLLAGHIIIIMLGALLEIRLPLPPSPGQNFECSRDSLNLAPRIIANFSTMHTETPAFGMQHEKLAKIVAILYSMTSMANVKYSAANV